MSTPLQISDDDILSLGFQTSSAFLDSLSNSIQNIESNLSSPSSTLSRLTKRTRTQISLSFKLFKDQLEPLDISDPDAIVVFSLCCIPENSNSTNIKEFLKDPPPIPMQNETSLAQLLHLRDNWKNFSSPYSSAIHKQGFSI